MFGKKIAAAVWLNVAVAGLAQADVSLTLNAELGYRYDNLDWNIAGNTAGQNPNILSELSWTRLQIPQATVAMELRRGDWYLLGDARYGKIVDGRNQDSDYAFDNRRGEWSRSNNKPGGEMIDATIGFGYRFERILRNKIQPYMFRHYVMPMVGYSYHAQNLRMTDGFQTIPATGSFPGLNSTYDARWDSLWGGISFVEEDIRKNRIIAVDFAVHVANFYAVAGWNLRVGPPSGFMQPKSFEQDANGGGFTVAMRGRNNLNKKLFVSWSVNYGLWKTGAGVDTIYIYDGSIRYTRLNEVTWETMSVNLGVGLRL